MTDYHIAQINIGRMLAPLTDPVMADFMNNLDPINALAEAADGFVWRLQTDDGDATALRPFDDDWLIVNMSLWEDIDSLFEYTYKGDHVAFVRRRTEWFSKLGSHHLALWWVAAGTLPTVDDAKVRLDHMDKHGPTPFAFTFKQRFSPEEMEAYVAGHVE